MTKQCDSKSCCYSRFDDDDPKDNTEDNLFFVKNEDKIMIIKIQNIEEICLSTIKVSRKQIQRRSGHSHKNINKNLKPGSNRSPHTKVHGPLSRNLFQRTKSSEQITF